MLHKVTGRSFEFSLQTLDVSGCKSTQKTTMNVKLTALMPKELLLLILGEIQLYSLEYSDWGDDIIQFHEPKVWIRNTGVTYGQNYHQTWFKIRLKGQKDSTVYFHGDKEMETFDSHASQERDTSLNLALITAQKQWFSNCATPVFKMYPKKYGKGMYDLKCFLSQNCILEFPYWLHFFVCREKSRLGMYFN